MNKIQHAAWFAAGIGLGIASTWLIATPRGRRARRNMARMLDQSCEDFQKATKNVKDRGMEMVDRGMEMVDSGKEFVRTTGAELGRRLNFAAR